MLDNDYLRQLVKQVNETYGPMLDRVADLTKTMELADDYIRQNHSALIETQSYLLENTQQIVDSVRPMQQFLTNYGLAINEIVNNLNKSGFFTYVSKKLAHDNDAIEAFISAGWPIAPSMSVDIQKRVIELHQRGSNQMSNAIIGYYHKNDFLVLDQMVDGWNDNPLFATRMKILNSARNAHKRGEYELSVPTLLKQIEGLIREIANSKNLPYQRAMKDAYNDVVGDPNNHNLGKWATATALIEVLNEVIYKRSEFPDEIKKAHTSRKVTRHSVLHGIAINYDRPIYSLKAMVTLDAISFLSELEE